MTALAGKRIGLLSAWASRANGGIFEVLVNQVAMLRELGAIPVIVAVREPAHDLDSWRLEGAEIVLVDGAGPRQLAYAPRLIDALLAARLDLLHQHGIWQYITHAAGAWGRRTGKPLLTSPHGMFDPWVAQRNKWKKWPARLLWERRGWLGAAAFHALTDAEAHDIHHELPDVRVATIPNAAPPSGPAPSYVPAPGIVYIGRIHIRKNLGALIAGWHEALPDLPPGASLTIAGWGDDEGIAQLQAQMKDTDPSISFVGTVFGSQKAALLDANRFLALPSVSEGLPMAILDAWAAGRPTIHTVHCHLSEGFWADGAIEIEESAHSIARALVEALTMSGEAWLDMATAAHGLATGLFHADTLRRRWAEVYSRLIAGET